MDSVNRAIVEAGVLVDIVDVGGGFPAIYPGMTPPPMIEYVNAIKIGFEEMFVAQNAKLWAEPGRALVAEAGSTVTRVELRKGDALYLNDGAFGTLFDATHLNWAFPAKLLREQPSRAKLAPFRLYGPTCDSMDAAAGPFMLPADIREGDLDRDRLARRLRHRDGHPLQRLRRNGDDRVQGRAVADHVRRSDGQGRRHAKAQARHPQQAQVS